MFLRKLFSPGNKFTWVLIDLIIVIIGVYSAFLIQQTAEQARNRKEKEHVLSAIKIEMEYFRYRMYETSLGMAAKAAELNTTLAEGSYSNFSDYRFIEPQYDYQTIQYALNFQNPDVVDFELYNVLQSLYIAIKKIENAEAMLTEISARYLSIPAKLTKDDNEYQLLWAENYDNFKRFATLINDRQSISARIAKASADALPIVNQRLGKKKSREIEKDIIIDNAALIPDEDQAIKLAQRLFPDFTEEELRSFYRQAKDKQRE